MTRFHYHPPMAVKILGYTESGKPVFEPGRGAPDTNNILKFRNTKDKYVGWTKADHIDASNILTRASAETSDSKKRRLASGWAAVHWDIGGRWLGNEAEARSGREIYKPSN